MRILFGFLLCVFLVSCSKDAPLQESNTTTPQDQEISEMETSARSVFNDCCQDVAEGWADLIVLCENVGGVYCDQLEALEQEIADCVRSYTIECPPGYEYDGENCYSGKHIPEGFRIFFYQGQLYVSPNCTKITTNSCCPPGFTFDGVNCYSGLTVPEGYDWFRYNTGFYLEPTSEDCREVIPGCCPDGFDYDGANCTNGKKVPAGYNAFIFNNAFFVTPDCNISTANSCCPEGYMFDGANCRSGISWPDGHTGFIYNDTYYITPGDECPE